MDITSLETAEWLFSMIKNNIPIPVLFFLIFSLAILVITFIQIRLGKANIFGCLWGLIIAEGRKKYVSSVLEDSSKERLNKWLDKLNLQKIEIQNCSYQSLVELNRYINLQAFKQDRNALEIANEYKNRICKVSEEFILYIALQCLASFLLSITVCFLIYGK